MLDFCEECAIINEINTAFGHITSDDIKYRFVIDMRSIKKKKL
jgi:D-arabinose 1-dehydrogenase-like Zn-dependent alcohol dehydrogenase